MDHFPSPSCCTAIRASPPHIMAHWSYHQTRAAASLLCSSTSPVCLINYEYAPPRAPPLLPRQHRLSVWDTPFIHCVFHDDCHLGIFGSVAVFKLLSISLFSVLIFVPWLVVGHMYIMVSRPLVPVTSSSHLSTVWFRFHRYPCFAVWNCVRNILS